MIPQPDDLYILQTDASLKGNGAILSVKRDGKEMPTGFFTKKLSDAETRYTDTELEGLAVGHGVEHFKAYLIG